MSFKEQLRDEILPKTVEYYNSGFGINESIVKAASDFKLNIDQTDRLVETMNTARTIAHFEKNADDRTQNFDIADKNKVHRLLFEDPAEKKASAEPEAGLFDYMEYDMPERNYREVRSDGAELEKAAEANRAEDGAKGFSERRTVEEVVKYAGTLEELRKFASSRLEMAEMHVSDEIGKIASSLSKGYDPERRFAIFKVAAAKYDKVLPEVEKLMHPQIVKDAASHLKAIRKSNVLDTSEVSGELKIAKDLQESYPVIEKIRSREEGLRKKEAAVKKQLEDYQSATMGDTDFFAVKSAAKDSGGDKGGKGGKGGGGKTDPWLGKAVKDMVPDAPAGAKNMYDFLSGGAMDAKKIDETLFPQKQKKTELKDYVNNMRRSDIITELYEEDPILSEASPEDVSRAYATLIQTSPEASLNKEIVRAILRQSVNSVAVSPFDAKQWADLDKTMLEGQKLKAQLSGRAKL